MVASGGVIQAREKTSDELLKILSAPSTSRKARIKAAAKLARKPPSEALPKIWKIRKQYAGVTVEWGMDHSGIKQSWEHVAHSTADYAWSANLHNPAYSDQEKGMALLGLLKQENTASDKASLLADLKFCC